MKRALTITAIIILLFIVIMNTNLTPISPVVTEALKRISDEYGKPVAQTVERMFRLETAHFKSEAFKATGGAGMQAITENYPYGWSMFRSLWDSRTDVAPVSLATFNDNATGQPIRFVVFPSIYAGMVAVAEYLKTHSPGNWNSNQRGAQMVYEAKLNTIIPRITNALT